MTRMLSILALAFLPSLGLAQGGPWQGVFTGVRNDSEHLVAPTPDAGAVRSRIAAADASLFEPVSVGDVLLMNLFQDAVYGCRVDRVRGRVFSGGLIGEEGSFEFVVDRGVVVGYIRTPDSVYRVHGTGARDELLIRISQLAPETDGGCEEVAAPEDGLRTRGSFGGSGEDGNDGTVIDVMVVYTAGARSAAGGVAAILAEIDLAVAVANISYENSGIDFSIRLVHTAEVDYDDQSGSFNTHLSRLRSTSDGFIDGVHQLRDDYGADLVSMFVSTNGSCGIAYTMSSLSPGFQSSGFSVVKWSCAVGNITFPHELGHNMGACHAIGDGCSGGLYGDSNGHRFYGQSGHRWRTVMAYAPGTRIMQFSNPSVEYDGAATGLQGEANNARSLNESAFLVSNFRTESIPCPADILKDGVLNFFDISAFLVEFNSGGLAADLTGDGVLNFFDISEFLAAYVAGCP